MGFVVNDIFPRTLNELEEFKQAGDIPLYQGGPMDLEHLYFIHRHADMIPGGEQVTAGIFIGGDFKKALSCLDKKMITDQDLKIFIGYCGWDPGQLEEEIAEGSWLTVNIPPRVIFSHPATHLWEQVYRQHLAGD